MLFICLFIHLVFLYFLFYAEKEKNEIEKKKTEIFTEILSGEKFLLLDRMRFFFLAATELIIFSPQKLTANRRNYIYICELIKWGESGN